MNGAPSNARDVTDALTANCPPTAMQQGMLFHWLKDPSGGVDMEQLVIELPGPLDPEALRRAWAKITARHAILRASFRWEGNVVLECAAGCDPAWAAHDWSALSLEEACFAFAGWLHEDRTMGFDLAKAPLQRVTVFQFPENLWRILWTFHHALLDRRSFLVVLGEIFAGLASPLTETETEAVSPDAAPGAAPTFLTFAEKVASLDHGAAEAAWRELLLGFRAPTPLGLANVGPCAAVPAQADARKQLSAGLTTALRSMAEHAGVTMHTVIQAAWLILLGRCSRETDVVCGAVKSCRKSILGDAGNDTPGLFINTLPVRAELLPEKPLEQLLRELRAQWVALRPHEHTPLPVIRSCSELPPETPLFHSIINFQEGGMEEFLRRRDPAWQGRSLRLYEKTSFPLCLVATAGAELTLEIEYDNTAFSAGIIADMLGHLAHLLQQMAERPHARLTEFALPPPRRTTQQSPPSPPEPADATLHDLFRMQARRSPDAVAVCCGAETLTYRELDQRSDAVACALQQRGAGPESIVGLCLDRGPALIVALLGILKSGAAYLPIDLSYPSDRLAFMLQDAQAPLLLTQHSLRDRVPEHAAGVLCIEDIAAAPSHDWTPPTGHHAEQMCYVLYTSGSTGKPKGCCVTHRNVTRLFSATRQWFDFGPQDVWTLFHSTAFDFSVWEIWGALLHGGRLVVVPYVTSRSPEEFYALLEDQRVTVLNQTPGAFRQLMAAEESAPTSRSLSLRYVIFGGEALEMQSLKPWLDRHGDRAPQLVNMYGITETTVHVTWRPLSCDDLRRGSVIGQPIPDLQIHILDDQLRPLPAGVPGEIFVGGAGLARGYLNRPELTSEKFIADHLAGTPGARLYRTGDLARLLPDGDIEYLGRIDHQVKIRGFRIELGEIESVLATHPSVREAVVIAREESPSQKRLCAYLVCRNGRPPAAELRAHLAASLPEHMLPASFVFLDRFPLTANGKLDHRALPQPENERDDAAVAPAAFVAPRNALEKSLTEIWEAVLKVDGIGINDNFFELGGDSILSIHLIARSRKSGIHFTPRHLFRHPTIAALAEALGDETRTAPRRPATVRSDPDSGDRDIPLLPIQQWFFEQNLPRPAHYNQAFLFTLTERLDPDSLRLAAHHLIHHHPALRLRFKPDSEWHAACALREHADVVECVSLAAVPEDEHDQHLAEIMDRAHRSLDIQAGPLLRFVSIDRGDDLPALMLIAIHHLAVDGVSWAVLLHDLDLACKLAVSGAQVRLPDNPASLQQAATALRHWSASPQAAEELPFWRRLLPEWNTANLPAEHSAADAGLSPGTDAQAREITVFLTTEQTAALVQMAPAAFKTRIDALLLAALALAFQRSLGRTSICLHLEGHGREEIYDGLDLSRTVGWFTSISPLRIEAPPESATAAVIAAAGERLRAVPHRGAGFLALRRLPGAEDLAALQSDILFNYLGRLDQLTEGLEFFAQSPQLAGAWRCPDASRPYALEIDSWVLNGRFHSRWRCPGSLAESGAIHSLTQAFRQALAEMSSLAAAAAEDPLSSLTAEARAAFAALPGKVVDVFPLSPAQLLSFTASAGKPRAGYDQWQCRIHGPLDPDMFRNAWERVVARHPILRSSFHAAGFDQPVQAVHAGLPVPWECADWSHLPAEEAAMCWERRLAADAARANNLSAPPLSRFLLAKVAPDAWRFLWSVPDLALDGWSWPVVFGEAARLYRSQLPDSAEAPLESALSYHDYLDWLAQHDAGNDERFWREEAARLRAPTPVPTDLPRPPRSSFDRHETVVCLAADFGGRIAATARSLRTTPGTLIQAAWALLLARGADAQEVVFGAAFNGRPAELPGVDSIVGPFVANLPVRIALDAAESVQSLLARLHAHQVEISGHQGISLAQVQEFSRIPWIRRLFDSLVVFQNYQIDDTLRRLGAARISSISGPIHTAYPLTIVVTPGDPWNVLLVADKSLCSQERAALLLQDFHLLLEEIVRDPSRPAADLLTLCRLPAGVSNMNGLPAVPAAAAANPAAPRSDMERLVAAVWQNACGLADCSVEENFFDLGGHSLLMLRVHQELQRRIGRSFPLVAVFQHPTIAALAAHLERLVLSADDPSTPTQNPGENENSLTNSAAGRALAARAAQEKLRQSRQQRAAPQNS